PHLATDRGVTVRELHTAAPHGTYSSLVALRVTTAEGTHTAEGTLGSDGSARLVKWGAYEIEAPLGGATLVVASLDKPGVIGFIGTTLGNAGVNIARVHLGKQGAGLAL